MGDWARRIPGSWLWSHRAETGTGYETDQTAATKSHNPRDELYYSSSTTARPKLVHRNRTSVVERHARNLSGSTYHTGLTRQTRPTTTVTPTGTGLTTSRYGTGGLLETARSTTETFGALQLSIRPTTPGTLITPATRISSSAKREHKNKPRVRTYPRPSPQVRLPTPDNRRKDRSQRHRDVISAASENPRQQNSSTSGPSRASRVSVPGKTVEKRIADGVLARWSDKRERDKDSIEPPSLRGRNTASYASTIRQVPAPSQFFQVDRKPTKRELETADRAFGKSPVNKPKAVDYHADEPTPPIGDQLRGTIRRRVEEEVLRQQEELTAQARTTSWPTYPRDMATIRPEESQKLLFILRGLYTDLEKRKERDGDWLRNVLDHVAELNFENARLVNDANRVKTHDRHWEQTVKQMLRHIEAMETLLTCPVCRSVIAKPFVLNPCGHTICEECLERWEAARVEMVELASCPICRADPDFDGAIQSLMLRDVIAEWVRHKVVNGGGWEELADWMSRAGLDHSAVESGR